MNLTKVEQLIEDLESLLQDDDDITEKFPARLEHIDDDLILLSKKYPDIVETEEFYDIAAQINSLNLDFNLGLDIESIKLVR